MLHFGKSSPDALKSAPHHALTHGQGFQQVQLEKMSPPPVFFSETNLAHFFGFPKMVTFPPSYIWMCILILQLPGGIHKFNSKVGSPSVPKKHPHPLSWNKNPLGFLVADIFKWFLHPLVIVWNWKIGHIQMSWIRDFCWTPRPT